MGFALCHEYGISPGSVLLVARAGFSGDKEEEKAGEKEK